MGADGDPAASQPDITDAEPPASPATPDTPNAPDKPPRTLRGWVRALLWITAVAAATAIGAGAIPWVWSHFHTHTVHADTDVDLIGSKNFSGGEYLLPLSIQDVGDPPTEANSCEGRYAWAHGKGAVDANVTNFRITVTALDGHNVQVVGARPLARENSPRSPLVGSVLTCPGKGAEPVNLIQFDLDNGRSVYYDGRNPEGTDLNVAVPGGRTEVFDVSAGTAESSWVYDMELILRVDGEEVVETIDNGGQHFRTSAATDARRYQRTGGNWVDIDAGGGSPPVASPTTIPTACTLLAASDLDIVGGGRFEQRDAFAPTQGPSGAGATVVTTFCSWYNSKQESVQLTLGGSLTPEEARREYDFQIKVMKDQGANADDLKGYADVKLLSNGTMIALRGSRTLSISIVRPDNRTTPFDSGSLQTLLDEALDNLGN